MTDETTQTTEYQIGAHDINKSTTLDGGTSIEFDFENAAVFKRLADDIYESPEAGIREPLQNALTAIRRAITETDLDPSEGVVEIEVKDGDQVGLVLQDNGLGISREVLNEVLTVIGRSQNRDDGEVSGKYGMGFLACYKLVGTDGGFIMYTNSRETDGETINGIWKPGMFELDEEGILPDIFDYNEYGTRFEFTLRQDIRIDDVRNWVEKHARWARVPIIYREYDANESLVYDDEFGIQRLHDVHGEANFKVTLDTDYFTAICSDDAEGRTLLLNSPIKRNSNYSNWRRGEVPRRVDIRLKNENGIVVKGPHEGLMPVSEAEYNNMDEGRREGYIPETKLILPQNDDEVMDNGVDVVLPQPTGTRDTLERDSYFWSYLFKRLRRKGEEKLGSYIQEAQTPDEFFTLEPKKQAFITSALNRFRISKDNPTSFKSEIQSEVGIDISEIMAKFYVNMADKVFHVKRGASEAEASRKKSEYTTEVTVSEVLQELSDAEDVYMGVSMHKPKMDAVWDANSDNILVRVEKAEVYSLYEDLYEWRQLQDVKDYIDIDSLSKNVRESLQSKKGKKKNAEKGDKQLAERKLTLHRDAGGRNKYTLDELSEMYNDGDEMLVLFPSNTEENLSDYYDIVSDDVSIANSLVKMWDYLSDVDNITRIEEWKETVDEMKFTSSMGPLDLTGSDLATAKNANILFHVVDDDIIDAFRNQSIMDELVNIPNEETIQEGSRYKKLARLNSSNTIYVPVTATELNYLRILFLDDDSRENIYTVWSHSTPYIGTVYSPTNSDLYWYAWARLPSWRGSNRLKALQAGAHEFTAEWRSIIDSIAERKERIPTASKPNIADMTTFETSEGELTVTEIEARYDVVIAHLLPASITPVFRNDNIISDAKEYVYQNAAPSSTGWRRKNQPALKTEYDKSDTIYIPLTEGELKHLKSITGDMEFHTVSTSKHRYNCNSTIGSHTAAYASARLPSWLSEVIVPEDDTSSMKNMSNGGFELVETLAEANDV